MSRSVWILLILLVLWILLGLYFWNFTFGKSSDDSAPCVISWELKDGTTVVAESDATINFPKSSSKANKLDASVSTALTSISDYLKKNTNKVITVIGYFDKEETVGEGSSQYDLAVARANAVKSMLTQKGVSANQLKIAPMMYKENDDNSHCLDGGVLNRGASFHMGTLK